jgi:hypothetical protein
MNIPELSALAADPQNIAVHFLAISRWDKHPVLVVLSRSGTRYVVNVTIDPYGSERYTHSPAWEFSDQFKAQAEYLKQISLYL